MTILVWTIPLTARMELRMSSSKVSIPTSRKNLEANFGGFSLVGSMPAPAAAAKIKEFSPPAFLRSVFLIYRSYPSSPVAKFL